MSHTARDAFWKKMYRYKIHHILLWVSYFVFWILLYRPYYPSLYPLIFNTSIYFIFTATAFYITVYYLFPKFLNRNQYYQFFVWFIGLVLIFSVGLATSLHLIIKGTKISLPFIGLFQIAILSIGPTVGVLCAVKLIINKMNSDRTLELMDKQRLESELQFLKAQVNPHFLFNAINSVYFLIKKNPEQAAETLIKLSDLLRFQLYDCLDEKIDIDKEMDYLNNFIVLEKIRKGEKVKVNLASETLSGFQIAPFMLIPFLENAFKYVSNFSDRENVIEIRFGKDESHFTAYFCNTTNNVTETSVGGIGLKNVKRRLALLYPGKHELKIHKEAERYFVLLKLAIK